MHVNPEHDAAPLLAAVVESSDDAILTKDLNGIVTSWNQGAERIFGYTADEVVGRSVTMLMPPERRDEETRILNRIRKGERIDHYETVRRRKDGVLLDISLTISPLKSRDGAIVGASKIARDITDRKRTERELERVRDELHRQNDELESRVRERTAALHDALDHMEEFSYSISHDLRSPVRAMHGYARVLMHDYGHCLDEVGRDHLQRIMRSSEHMDRLIHDLLAYSRISYTDLKPDRVSLDDLVPALVHRSAEISASEARVTVERPLPDVLAHEATMNCVIGNLLDNALKFVRPGQTPEIRIWSERMGSMVRLNVQDDGVGIRPEHQSRLFGMFERVHPAGRFDGTGVGLAIVKKAVERMNGAVGLESDGTSGSRFWIDLPVADVT